MLVAVNVIAFMFHYVNSPWRKRTRFNHVTHHNGHPKSEGYPIRSFSLDVLAGLRSEACLSMHFVDVSLELMYNVSC